MSEAQDERRVRLDLNNPEFQERLFSQDKGERNRVIDTLAKIQKMTWSQVYRHPGLKWEEIKNPPVKLQSGESIYSIRISQARRAVVTRRGDFMRFLTLPMDHDSTYEGR